MKLHSACPSADVWRSPHDIHARFPSFHPSPHHSAEPTTARRRLLFPDHWRPSRDPTAIDCDRFRPLDRLPYPQDWHVAMHVADVCLAISPDTTPLELEAHVARHQYRPLCPKDDSLLPWALVRHAGKGLPCGYFSLSPSPDLRLLNAHEACFVFRDLDSCSRRPPWVHSWRGPAPTERDEIAPSTEPLRHHPLHGHHYRQLDGTLPGLRGGGGLQGDAKGLVCDTEPLSQHPGSYCHRKLQRGKGASLWQAGGRLEEAPQPPFDSAPARGHIDNHEHRVLREPREECVPWKPSGFAATRPPSFDTLPLGSHISRYQHRPIDYYRHPDCGHVTPAAASARHSSSSPSSSCGVRGGAASGKGDNVVDGDATAETPSKSGSADLRCGQRQPVQRSPSGGVPTLRTDPRQAEPVRFAEPAVGRVDEAALRRDLRGKAGCSGWNSSTKVVHSAALWIQTTASPPRARRRLRMALPATRPDSCKSARPPWTTSAR